MLSSFVDDSGDSRAYFLRGERIRQITRDQSFVESLIEAEAISEEEAAQSPYRNVILQAIGRKKSVEVALDAVDLSLGPADVQGLVLLIGAMPWWRPTGAPCARSSPTAENRCM